VEVLDDEQDGCGLRGTAEIGVEGAEQLGPLRCRIDHVGPGGGAEAFRQLGRHPGQCRRSRPGPAAGLGIGQPRQVFADGLHERLVWRLHVLEARTEQHLGTGRVDLGGELGDEPALADAGFAGHHCRQQLPCRRPLPQLPELRALLVTSHEAVGVGEQFQRGRELWRTEWRRRRQLLGQLGQCEAVVGRQLAQQGRHVGLHGPLRHVQARRDLGVGQAVPQRVEHLGFPPGDAPLLQQRAFVRRRRHARIIARPGCRTPANPY
jgi:hypothetical protein